VAGAAGARSVITPPLALLLGDVSLLHDVGGLAAAAAVHGPLPIVVVHNDGGRIFERLPLGQDASVAGRARQALRGAAWPHPAGPGRHLGLPYRRVQTPAELSEALGGGAGGRSRLADRGPRRARWQRAAGTRCWGDGRGGTGAVAA
jgi:2-succinyl-5-enolpyruvyl-6-hydroxy-3-cyclohexene-1-carboxylate synthase